uniref:Uncharacterized protein n=1 Tax=Megaviridae environmental sample TaxID=1737588 RepID=A0A5J6VJT7_9VIRU|nr:MAG: hypothetical protein [Megaviridae environmental sample]
MEQIKCLERYNTDTFGSWGLQTLTLDINIPFEDILKFTIDKKCHMIIKPSRGKCWYIKKCNSNIHDTNYNLTNIKQHIVTNENNKFKPNSTIWLIDYIF